MLRLGEVLYWSGIVASCLIGLWAAWGSLYNSDKGDPIIQVVPLLFAGII
jgi:hypothetical protein